jgi:hypothetical protein
MLDFLSPDKHGFMPDAYMIGNVLQHTGNQKQYVIIGFTWLGATDEWGYEHREIGDLSSPTITRPLSHLCGKRGNDDRRYFEYSDYGQFEVRGEEEAPDDI